MSEFNSSVEKSTVPTANPNKLNAKVSKSTTSKPATSINASSAPSVGDGSSSSGAPPARNLPQKKNSISNWLKIGVMSAAEVNSVREMEANDANAATVATAADANEPPPADRASLLNQFTRSASWLGLRVFSGMEYVGEAVVSTLGLDDSAYQDVLDNMTEDEMNRARQVQLEREQEFERVRSVRQMREADFGVDVEANLPLPAAAPDSHNSNEGDTAKPPLPPSL